MRWTAATASAPAISISPMWLTSNSPARVRTAMCSSVIPRVFDRHVPAAERDHSRAERSVARIERSLLERAGGRLGHQLYSGDWRWSDRTPRSKRLPDP